MIDKSYVKEIIQHDFPDLAHTRFSINGREASSFTEQSLIPFLIYQNTIDVHHRLIGLYLPENCSIINLIPFYIMTGQYRKALDSVMQEKNYRNQSYKPNQKQLVYNGDICSISAIDFINRQLIFRSGRGRVTSLSFLETYKVNWSKNAHDIRDQIESFEVIDKAEKSNIFTFPVAPASQQYGGVIIFTNTSKFESLLRNVRVSGTDLREHLNIQKVVFPADDGDIKFVNLSKPRTGKKPVSLLIARRDSFRAYASILEAGGSSLNHIRTIIIDDFDEMLSRWERSDSHREEIGWLNDNYFQKVQNREIKDLYLISRNSNIYIHGLLKELKITCNTWLTKPVEELILNRENGHAHPPEISLSNIQDATFEKLNGELTSLAGKWKMLAQTSFCNGEILSPINCLFELRTKLNSFFDPETLKDFTEDFLNSLDQLQARWFAGGQDFNTIEDTRSFIRKNFGSSPDFANFKLQPILDNLKQKDASSSVYIVSDNTNADDAKWLSDSISTIFPDVSIISCHKKDFLVTRQHNPAQPTTIFYLTSDKKIIGAASGNVLAEEQVFILNRRTYSFTESYLKKCRRLQLDAGSALTKYELLNIKAPSDAQLSEASGLITVRYDRRETAPVLIENEVSAHETELQELVEQIFKEHYSGSSKEPGDKCILFFDDGSLMTTPESRHFFVYEDDKEAEDFEKSFRPVTSLMQGDQIITARRGLQVKDLLEQALKKDPAFSLTIETDRKWRLLLKNHIIRCRMDLQFFCRKLQDNGFKIGPATVKNWIDGDTQRPDNFVSLLHSLCKLGIINKDEIDLFNKHNADLKSIQAGFVRTAIRRLIARLYGIRFQEDEIFTESLLNDFINHIEIKRISTIYKM